MRKHKGNSPLGYSLYALHVFIQHVKQSNKQYTMNHKRIRFFNAIHQFNNQFFSGEFFHIIPLKIKPLHTAMCNSLPFKQHPYPRHPLNFHSILYRAISITGVPIMVGNTDLYRITL